MGFFFLFSFYKLDSSGIFTQEILSWGLYHFLSLSASTRNPSPFWNHIVESLVMEFSIASQLSHKGLPNSVSLVGCDTSDYRRKYRHFRDPFQQQQSSSQHLASGDAIIPLKSLSSYSLQQEQQQQPIGSVPIEQLYASLPLSSDSRSIRLLDLDAPPRTANNTADTLYSQLSGHLRVVRLEDSPSFVSLSYVWGEKASPSHTLRCWAYGSDIEITANCHDALRHIRNRFGAVTIWVDSICINQDDKDEKSSQIPLMEEIYSSAESVFIWLGSGNQRSDRAMQSLQRWARFGRRIPLAPSAARNEEDLRRELRNFKQKAWDDMCCRLIISYRSPTV
jgi:Heterokaryon incompatibility protein (HET)